MEKNFDLVIKNARVVRPNKTSVDCLDIAVTDGKIARVAPEIRAEQAKEIFDAKNFLAFPGCVDAHMHVGIYQPLAQDAVSESKAAAMGGVTSSLNYMRTGQYYLNRGGPYRDFMPELHRQADGRFWVDYGFHIAPIEAAHIGEMEHLALDHGVTSFKIFMFYGGYGLHGRSSNQNDFLMIGPEERYDIAHFEFIMRSARRLMTKHPELADYNSVSLHCELAEILNAYTNIVEREVKLTGLQAYSAARPPHTAAGILPPGIGGIHVNADEQVGMGVVGDAPAVAERDERIGGAGVPDVDAALTQRRTDAPGHVQRDILFLHGRAVTEGAVHAAVRTAVPCVNHDEASLPQRTPGNSARPDDGQSVHQWLTSGRTTAARR